MRKSQETALKIAIFDLQNIISWSFFKISTCNFVHVYTFQDSFTYILFFIRKFSLIFLKIIIYGLFSRFWKLWKIWHSSLIELFILNFLLKTIWFYLLCCSRDNVSRKLLFLPKTGKTWRHSDVIYGRCMGDKSFSIVRMCQIDGFEGTEKIDDDPFVTSGDIAENETGGAKIAPPPSVAV